MLFHKPDERVMQCVQTSLCIWAPYSTTPLPTLFPTDITTLTPTELFHARLIHNVLRRSATPGLPHSREAKVR